ncbi:MAG: Hsp33 family molecular chaperone HslO, partial [Lachnospiraceae bacterium]|nr:Hsp33 family molecular chaperone HslO [Lachnospiraceae bacterium]
MSDYMLRATAAEGSIRAFAITSKDTVEKARKSHNLSPVATAALGRTLSAALMMGYMLKGDKDTVSIHIEGSGPM